jgi:hypothetical protein
MLIGGLMTIGYQMLREQFVEEEQVEEVQTTLAGLPDSVKTEMALKLEREAVLERVRTIYRVVKQECMYMGGSVDSDLLDLSFCSKSWNKLLMAVRSKEHNTGTLFFEVNKWTMAYESGLVDFDEFEVSDLTIGPDNERTATVTFMVYDSDSYTPARIELVYEDGNWKIDNFYHLKYMLNMRLMMSQYLGNDMPYLI